MTVAQLIAELEKMPKSMDVRIVYDSQVMCVAVRHVGKWHNSYGDKHIVVGIFDDTPEPDDDRLQPR